MKYTFKISNTFLFQILLVLLAILFMVSSRVDTHFLILFIILYFILAYTVYINHHLSGLILISGLTSIVLALRFKYLRWGDPWYEYAMVIRLNFHGNLASLFYPAQLPVVHLMLSTISVFTHIDPIILQKFGVPLISSISIIILYKITKEFFKEDVAILAGLLLVVGTPYLHWTTQGVRESVGISMVLLALYFSFKTIKIHQVKYLLTSALIIIGLVLTHHLSSAIFILVWIAFSLSYIYFVCDMKVINKSSIYSFIILLLSISIALWWWNNNIHGIFNVFKNALDSFFHSSHGLLIFVAILALLYAIPIITHKLIGYLQYLLNTIFSKKITYILFVILVVIASAFVVNFIRGKSFFVLDYPLTMMINGFIMIILSMVGFYYFFDLSKLPILSWIVVISGMLGLSIAKIIPSMDDPLRFMEFLYVPLAIVSAVGFKQVANKINIHSIRGVIIATIMVISLVTSFPPIVFWGKYFEQGNLRYDNRSWIISHPESEIKTIIWLHDQKITGNIYTDTYIYYATKWIEYDNNNIVINEYRRVNPNNFPKEQNNYVIITERMKKYAEFGEWLRSARIPLQKNEIQKLNEETSNIYNNSEARIFYTQ